MKRWNCLWRDTRGYAVVEATILFPIMMMIFAGLVLLAIYLPNRAVLQRATQYAATAMATESSDTWIYFDENNMEYKWYGGRFQLPNVYVALFQAIFGGNVQSKGETIVKSLDNQSIAWRRGDLTVECKVNSFVIYKEISVTATRTIPMPVDLSFVKFPKEIPITVTSTAVVQNGDEFVRNIDLIADFIGYLEEQYPGKFQFLNDFKNYMDKAANFLGI